MELWFPHSMARLCSQYNDPEWQKRPEAAVARNFVLYANQAEHYIIPMEMVEEARANLRTFRDGEVDLMTAHRVSLETAKKDLPMPFDYMSLQTTVSGTSIGFSVVGKESLLRTATLFKAACTLKGKPLESRAAEHLQKLADDMYDAIGAQITLNRRPDGIYMWVRWLVFKNNEYLYDTHSLSKVPFTEEQVGLNNARVELVATKFNNPEETLDSFLVSTHGSLYSDLYFLLTTLNSKKYVQGIESHRCKTKAKIGKFKTFVQVRRVIHVSTVHKKSSTESLGNKIDWHVRFRVPGHMMRNPGGPTSIGKDHKGVRDGSLVGWTWRNSYTKGPPDAPLISRTHSVLDQHQT